MRRLITLCLELRVVVVALAAILMVAGIRVARTTPLDVFPEFAPPLVEIQTEAAGLSTAEVESLISVPIENALNGLQSLKTLRSKSVLGLSSVVCYFAPGADLMQARQLVGERLSTLASQLPAVARPPVILSPLSSTSRALKIGVWSRKLSQVELTTLARWTIRPRLMAIPGVANVAIWGQRDRQLQILVDPDRLRDHKITLDEVIRAVTLVKGTKVGEIYEEQKIFDVTVWGAPAVRRDLESLRHLRLDTPSGANIPLGDVADLRIAPTPNIINREAASRRIDVSCNVSGRDLGSVAREIERRVRALSFDRGYHPEFLGEYAARQESRHRLLTLGGVSVLGILLILHADFRSARLTLLVFVTLPFALVGGVAAAFLSGGVLSLGSLVGFVTVLGIAARNGIMLVSHYRHLQAEEGLPAGPELALRGAEERLAPILMTALATALALLPIALGATSPATKSSIPWPS